MKELLREILRLSNLDYCESSDDLQNNLEKIYDLIKAKYPNLEENTD